MTDVPSLPTPHPGMLYVDHIAEKHARHSHAAGQLQRVCSGLLSVNIGDGWWLMPPGRIGWLPPHWPHEGDSYGTPEVEILYVDPVRTARLPDRPTVVPLSPLSEAIFARLRGLDAPAEDPCRAHLLDVLCDEIRSTPADPLHLPLPRHPRLLRMCHDLMAHPEDPRTLPQWADALSLSPRTLSRYMTAETGLTFGAWRTGAKMMAAVRQLSTGGSVTETALGLGFDSISAFIAVFRRQFGVTPGQYVRRRIP